MSAPAPNVDAAEIARFDAMASRWWDPRGEAAMLHRLNPHRLAYIRDRAPLAGARCLDVGCGGGLLCEGLARNGAEVTGIDLAEESLTVARLHQIESSLPGIQYRRVAAEELAATSPGSWDVVTCLEMIEHVPDPAMTVATCAALTRPGGRVFFSTINRTALAYLVTILGAEYVLGIVPRGTHDYTRFVRPSELAAWARRAGLELLDVTGFTFDVADRDFRLGGDVSVNYISCFRRPP